MLICASFLYIRHHKQKIPKIPMERTYLHGRVQAAYGQELELLAAEDLPGIEFVRDESVEVEQGDADDLAVELVVIDDLEHPFADLAAPSLLDPGWAGGRGGGGR